MYSESSTGYLGVLAGRDTIGPAPPKQPSPADAQGSSGIKTHVHTLNASHFTWVTAVCVHEVGKALSLEAPPCQKNATGIRRARTLYTRCKRTRPATHRLRLDRPTEVHHSCARALLARAGAQRGGPMHKIKLQLSHLRATVEPRKDWHPTEKRKRQASWLTSSGLARASFAEPCQAAAIKTRWAGGEAWRGPL